MDLGPRQDKRKPRRAQAVIELAVFGAIVLFLIGLIISQGTNAASQQDTQLQAMRLALLSSYQSAEHGKADRNMASFVILEDRFSPGIGRYGVADRQPFMASGGGTMSKNLFKPIDWGDVVNPKNNDISVVDMRVNGQHFWLRSAMAATYRIKLIPHGGLGATTQFKPRVIISYVKACDAKDYCNLNNPGCEIIIEDSSKLTGPWPDWPKTSGVWPNGGARDLTFDPNADAKRLLFEWQRFPEHNYPPAYVMRVKNDAAHFVMNPDTCHIFDELRRYDLNRDGLMPDMCCPNPLAYVLWRWNWKDLDDVKSEIDTENGTYPSYDVDGDLIEEAVYGIRKWKTAAGACGGIYGYDIDVLDMDRGDNDTFSDSDSFARREDEPGMKDEMSINTFQKAGTYLDLNEVADTTGGRSTSTVKRNQEDMIQRVYILNRRMILGGGLCAKVSGAWKPLQPAVQKCCEGVNCCGQPVNINETCVELPPNGVEKQGSFVEQKLFIRSRLGEGRGRAWATDVTPSQ